MEIKSCGPVGENFVHFAVSCIFEAEMALEGCLVRIAKRPGRRANTLSAQRDAPSLEYPETDIFLILRVTQVIYEKRIKIWEVLNLINNSSRDYIGLTLKHYTKHYTCKRTLPRQIRLMSDKCMMIE